MTSFESSHADHIISSLTTFDRMIFKGHLTGLIPEGAFQRFLNTQGVLLKGYAGYVKGVSDELAPPSVRATWAPKGRDPSAAPPLQLEAPLDVSCGWLCPRRQRCLAGVPDAPRRLQQRVVDRVPH